MIESPLVIEKQYLYHAWVAIHPGGDFAPVPINLDVMPIFDVQSDFKMVDMFVCGFC